MRRSPRAALGSADSDPAKFESKILRPYRLGKRQKEVISPKSEPVARGGDSGVRAASQGGRLPAVGLPTGRDIGRSAGRRRHGDRPLGLELSAGRQRTGDAAASPAKPTDAHPCFAPPPPPASNPMPFLRQKRGVLAV